MDKIIEQLEAALAAEKTITPALQVAKQLAAALKARVQEHLAQSAPSPAANLDSKAAK